MPGAQQGRLVYETARVLAESATLADAAPRMLEAICQALGWEYGALWSVDQRRARSCGASARGSRPALPFDEFAAVSRRADVRAGHRAARSGVGDRGSRPGSPTSPATRTSRAPALADRESASTRAFGLPVLRDARSARRAWSSSAARFASPTRNCWPMLTTVGSQIGLFVERKRAQEELDRFFTLSLDLLLHRDLRRVLPPRQPRVGTRARLPARSSSSRGPWLDFVHPDDREATVSARISRSRRRERHRLREPLSLRGRLVQVAAVDRVGSRTQGLIYAVARDVTDRRAEDDAQALRARDGRREARAGAERRAPRPARQGARGRPSSAPKRPPSPRASSSPT